MKTRRLIPLFFFAAIGYGLLRQWSPCPLEALVLRANPWWWNTSSCSRCHRIWKSDHPGVEPRPVSIGMVGYFSLCRQCWKETTAIQRMHYYAEDWEKHWRDDVGWVDLMLAVNRDSIREKGSL